MTRAVLNKLRSAGVSERFPALDKAGQPSAEGAGGAVRSTSRSLLIDFREAHRIYKVLTPLINRPDSACGAVAPPCPRRGIAAHTNPRSPFVTATLNRRSVCISNLLSIAIRTRLVYDRPLFLE